MHINLTWFHLKKVWKLTIPLQTLLIIFLFVFRSVQAFNIQTGLVSELPKFVTIFAPIYEEVIFRGLCLAMFLKYFNRNKAIILSSLIFGLWHLKNSTHLSNFALLYQVSYAMFLIGPILAYITIKTKTIWPGIILHYVNNIISSLIPII
ncbi:CPBP family intramembrane metalloprotease [bacterium]|nr:MAG: CPBP family intramembrane metalloprotease [bacterium]